MPNLPLEMERLHRMAADCGIVRIGTAGIRQLRRLVDRIEAETGLRFIRMEMGIPGLPSPDAAVQGEIQALQQGVGAVYPPFEGIAALKTEIARFIQRYTDVTIAPPNCFPTLGAMQGCYLGMALAARRYADKTRILFIDPGFPVNKLQARSLGLTYTTFDLADYRENKLASKLESVLAAGDYAAIVYANPSNPAWLCLSATELEIIGAAAHRHDLVVIEDLAYFGMDFRTDYRQPGKPPFVPTVAHHADHYLLIISSSKIFSLAGQRIGMLAISNSLARARHAHLKRFYPSDVFSEALAYGGLYAIGAGVSHSAQFGLLALLQNINRGRYDFLETVRIYAQRAARLKTIFRANGFQLVYDRDGERRLADGFYFTVAYPGMAGSDLVTALMRFGISAIALDATGSARQGVRACVSQIAESDFDIIAERLAHFQRVFG
ncbi:MAG: pyridoxal phosphate-dependent aminotransferase [Desulfobacterales bacterium]|nr:pyridoxal phosphate-dependent aminotransferase [Desulfobacterales bacterium]